MRPGDVVRHNWRDEEYIVAAVWYGCFSPDGPMRIIAVQEDFKVVGEATDEERDAMVERWRHESSGDVRGKWSRRYLRRMNRRHEIIRGDLSKANSAKSIEIVPIGTSGVSRRTVYGAFNVDADYQLVGESENLAGLFAEIVKGFPGSEIYTCRIDRERTTEV